MSATQETKKPSSLEDIVANTCFCKLREQCPDKNSCECMKDRNIYKEFMLGKS